MVRSVRCASLSRIELSSCASTGHFRRTRGRSSRVLTTAPQAAPWDGSECSMRLSEAHRTELVCVDRSFQTDAWPKLTRPDDGTASGAVGWFGVFDAPL